MMIRIILLLLLLLSLFLELTIISLPLIFIFTYVIFATGKRIEYLVPAALLSIAGDAVLLNPLGSTLIVVCVAMLMIHIYSTYLGSKDTLVYVLFGVIGVVGYAIIFQYSGVSLLKWSTVLVVLWIIYRLIPNKYFSL